jgi:hypothetical protein
VQTDTYSTYAAAATTYIVAVISMFYSSALENYSSIAAVLGFLLLVARLIQELPKAWEVLFRKKKKPTNDDTT